MGTHRERVLTALSHEAPDRCPMQISFTPEFAARLRGDLGLSEADMVDPVGGGKNYALQRATDQDVLVTSVGWVTSYYATELYGEDGKSYTDEWGVGWRAVPYDTRFGRGYYTEIVGHPLAEDDAIAGYQPPDPERPELYQEAARVIRAFGDEYWIVGSVGCTIWETAWALRGLESMYLDLVRDRELANEILDIPYHYHLAAAKELVGLGVDMIKLGDDMGGQDSMLISPAMWRCTFKSRMAEFVAALKEINPDVKVAYHSDGVINPIIGDLIEIGVDVLNPIQPRCMDPADLKRRFGQHLCFWGSVDVQRTLPFGTPDDVREEVLDRLRTVGWDGGLIIGPTHMVQLDTPLENFWAMVDAVQGIPSGPGRARRQDAAALA